LFDHNDEGNENCLTQNWRDQCCFECTLDLRKRNWTTLFYCNKDKIISQLNYLEFKIQNYFISMIIILWKR